MDGLLFFESEGWLYPLNWAGKKKQRRYRSIKRGIEAKFRQRLLNKMV